MFTCWSQRGMVWKKWHKTTHNRTVGPGSCAPGGWIQTIAGMQPVILHLWGAWIVKDQLLQLALLWKHRARGRTIASPAPPKKTPGKWGKLNGWTNNFVEKNMRLLSNKLAWGGWASSWKLLTSEKEKLSRRFWAWVKLTSHFGRCLIRPSRIFTHAQWANISCGFSASWTDFLPWNPWSDLGHSSKTSSRETGVTHDYHDKKQKETSLAVGFN